MKAVNYSWWIGAIISPILHIALLASEGDDVGGIILIGIINGLFWGWIIGVIIDKLRGKKKDNSSEVSANAPLNTPISRESVNENAFSETDKNEIAELLEKFSRNQEALDALKEINSTETGLYFKKFSELFKKEVYRKTGVNLLLIENSYKFRSFLFSFKTRVVELDKGRGKLLFISNNLGDVFKNHEGRTICSNKYIILGIEEGRLTRWFYMHLTGRIHEPQLFLLKEDDIIPCGSLPDASYNTLFNELHMRLEKIPTQADWENLLNDFYNKI